MSLLNTIVVKTLPFVPKSVVGQVSKRYIAGTSLDDAVRVLKGLNTKGMLGTIDLLGEDVHEEAEALGIRDEWLKTIKTLHEQRLHSNVSLKLSQVGLRIDKELCFKNLRSVVDAARAVGNFVRIDMEDSSTTDDTLMLYRRLRGDGYDNTGVVIQAYLRRSEEDVRSLAKLKASFRLCKGIYIEPERIAYRDREEVRKNFVLLLKTIMEGDCHVGIATHDEVVVNQAYELIARYRLPKDRYEFQMLLGVRKELRDSIVHNGHPLRVYVPYGEQWYAYSVRRLKESPQIAGYVLKAMVGLNNSK